MEGAEPAPEEPRRSTRSVLDAGYHRYRGCPTHTSASNENGPSLSLMLSDLEFERASTACRRTGRCTRHRMPVYAGNWRNWAFNWSKSTGLVMNSTAPYSAARLRRSIIRPAICTCRLSMLPSERPTSRPLWIAGSSCPNTDRTGSTPQDLLTVIL